MFQGDEFISNVNCPKLCIGNAKPYQNLSEDHCTILYSFIINITDRFCLLYAVLLTVYAVLAVYFEIAKGEYFFFYSYRFRVQKEKK